VPRRSLLHVHETDDTHRVTPLELLFDLVFVFAITQVTSFLAASPHPLAAFRGLVTLGLLWFGWSAYSWLGNQAKADEGLMRLTVVLAMAAMFIVALTIPEAWHDRPGGVHSPLIFAFSYIVVRGLHLTVYFIAAGSDTTLRRTLTLTSIPAAVAMALLVVGALAPPPARTLLWTVAAVVDFTGVFVTARMSPWRLPAAGHFAERHGLIVLIALGESVVAIGVGASADPITWPVLVSVLLGLAVTFALWWLYFDVVALVAEGVLRRATGVERARLAGDSYTFLHFPMVVGIVYLALGLKKVELYVSDSSHHDLSEPLTGVPLLSLYGGVVLYLVAHIFFRLRNVHSVNVQRLGVAVLLVVLIPVAWRLPALASLGLLAAVLVVLVTYEAVAHADWRAEVRHQERDAAEVPADPSRPDEHDGHPATEDATRGLVDLED
jgi:low temperature requirement protein LtrA